jgi:Uma2 family endonuclease
MNVRVVALAKVPVRMTVAEFLQWDAGDDRRYELVDGKPHAMAPASAIHAFLQNELGSLIRNHVRSRAPGCEVLANPGVIPRLLSDHNVRVPDLAVTCEPVLVGQATVVDPVLLIEILSPSSQAKTWANVWAYTSIPSVREILVLRADHIGADLLRRDVADAWLEQPARSGAATSCWTASGFAWRSPNFTRAPGSGADRRTSAPRGARGRARVSRSCYDAQMVALAKVPVRMTVAEFLQWDADDDRRYELVDGEPRAMVPASAIHAFLQNELGRLIGNHLRERAPDCEVLANPGVVPRLLSDHNVRVPDLAVTCAPVRVGQATIVDPVLLVEILSPSNQAETWANVWAYTSIPSVGEIFVLRADRIAAELLRRSPSGEWPERPEAVADGDLVLASIGFRVTLTDLYARTDLTR